MAFYSELVDDESAMSFFNEAMATVEKLQTMPYSNPEFLDDPDVRKIIMKQRKVAIVYLIDDGSLEVVAVRAYHQMQAPAAYQQSVVERIRKVQSGE